MKPEHEGFQKASLSKVPFSGPNFVHESQTSPFTQPARKLIQESLGDSRQENGEIQPVGKYHVTWWRGTLNPPRFCSLFVVFGVSLMDSHCFFSPLKHHFWGMILFCFNDRN